MDKIIRYIAVFPMQDHEAAKEQVVDQDPTEKVATTDHEDQVVAANRAQHVALKIQAKKVADAIIQREIDAIASQLKVMPYKVSLPIIPKRSE